MLISNTGHGERGFTLVELTIVLVIVATVLTMGLRAINAQLISANYASTKKRQDTIKDALIAYFGANLRLPCPNVPTVGTAIDGNQGVFHATQKRCDSAVGVIPFRELGLTREAAEDGWGNLLTYYVYQQATPVCPGTGVSWGHKDCYGAGKTGAISLRQDATVIGEKIVAVALSHGGNGLGAWIAQGTRNVLPAGCQELRNAGGAAGCTAGDGLNTFYKGERPEQNDDVLITLTANDIIVPLAKQGAAKIPIAQVAVDLDTIKYDVITEKKTVGCAGALTYTPPRDPWGNLYVLGGGTGFPITITTNGCASCTPVVAPVSKSISPAEFNLLTGSAC